MAIQDNCIIWSKLGSDAEVTVSEIGVGAVVGNPAYVAGVFGNAVTNLNAANSVVWTAGVPDPTVLITEFHWRPNYNFNTATNNLICNFTNGVDDRLRVQHRTVLDNFDIYLYDGPAVAVRCRYEYDNFNYVSGTWYHILIATDSGEANQNRIKLYVDGVFQTPTVYNVDGAWALAALDAKFDSGAVWVPNATHDNLKVYDSTVDTAAIIANRNNEGWPLLAPTPVAVPELEIRNPVVSVMGLDLFKSGEVSKLPVLTYFKTFNRDKFITNNIEIEAGNEDNLFSLEHPNSLIAGQQWRYSPVEIWDRWGIKIWDGEFTGIKTNYFSKKATILSKNTLFKWRTHPVVYTSAGAETPAAAFKNVCDAIGFTAYNTKAQTDSAAVQAVGGMTIRLDIKSDDNMTFQQVAERLADYGAADLYDYDNEIFYVAWEYFTGGIRRTINKDDVKKRMGAEWIERDMKNEYAIPYVGMPANTPATDANSNNIGEVSRTRHDTHQYRNIPGKLEDQYQLQDKASATFLGEQYIKSTHKNLSTQPEALIGISFDLKLDNRFWIDLQTFFEMDWPDENWTDKIFEVFKVRRDENRELISITAYELPTE